MKKRINNRLYNTDTAKRCGTHESTGSCELAASEETLYVKRNGEYFLYGQGGPMTTYATTDETGDYGYGEDIRPLNTSAARAWAAAYLSAEANQSLFGESARDHDTVYTAADDRGLSVDEYISLLNKEL